MSTHHHPEKEAHKPIWMVRRTGLRGEATFGPFAAKGEAELFASRSYGGYVYDHVLAMRSNCGPWPL